MNRKRSSVIIRRCNLNEERKSCSYVIARPEAVGRGNVGQYRFAKTSRAEAEIFDVSRAKNVLRSLRQADPNRKYSDYTLVTL